MQVPLEISYKDVSKADWIEVSIQGVGTKYLGTYFLGSKVNVGKEAPVGPRCPQWEAMMIELIPRI